MLAALYAVIAPTLAVVFAIAAVSKLRSPLSVDRSFRDLAVPPQLGRPWMRRAFPWCELALALLLLAAWGWAAIVAAALSLALVAAYLVLVARAVAAPEPVSCSCFGESNDRPVDRHTLARNLVLVGVAGLGVVAVAISPEARASAWPMLAVEHLAVVLGAAIVAGVVLALGRNGDLTAARPLRRRSRRPPRV